MNHSYLTLGIPGYSTKENEYRLPIHPSHFSRIDPDLQKRIYVEKGYGKKFGANEKNLRKHTAGQLSREALFENCDIILLPKPTEADFPFFREGQVLWGWPHCVQGQPITQMAIDKKMTLIAWEAMFKWKTATVPELHTFYKNNEMAGYCSVLHSLRLKGITGHYGVPKRVAILSFGATARGAIHALKGQGFTDITVFTRRPASIVQNPIPSLSYRQMKKSDDDPTQVIVRQQEETASMAEELSGYDIIVNCILQDTDKPLMFVDDHETALLKPGSLIIDVSCDDKIGFAFAQPTSFETPSFEVGDRITYYAVDHTPSYLWNSATEVISNALLPYLPVVMKGEEAWETEATIHKAIEIRNGEILNPKIKHFQRRKESYPHKIMA